MRGAPVVALVGPPGSGKTYVGHLLARQLGYAFSDVERELMERYGSREAFLEDKDEALALRESELRKTIESSHVPVVIESTGLSDRVMLEGLQSEFTVILVKLWSPSETCVARVRSRKAGSNFSNSPEDTARLHEIWMREAAPSYDFDLEMVNDGKQEREIVDGVARLVALRACR